MRGRRPTPTALRELTGNPQHRPLNDAEPKPKAVLPTPPKELSPAAKKLYKRIGQQLVDLGIAGDIDGYALAAMAQAYADYLECIALARGPETQPPATAEQPSKPAKLVTQHVVTIKGQPQTNAYLRRADECLKTFARLAMEFGMTAASRTRLTTTDDQGDELEMFLRGTNSQMRIAQ